MTCIKFILVLAISILVFTTVNAEDDVTVKPKKPFRGQGTVADRTRLVETLFKHYNKLVKPDNSTMKFGVALINLGVDEENSAFNTYGWLRYLWFDERLRWDPKDYGGVEVLRLSSDEVWKPDITLYNSADTNMMNCWNSNILMYPGGDILWVPPCKLRSQCHYTLNKEPYGPQTCTLKFGSWTYDGNILDLQFYANQTAIDLSDMDNTSNFEVLSTTGERNVRYYACCKEPYVDVTFNITVKRIPGEELLRK